MATLFNKQFIQIKTPQELFTVLYHYETIGWIWLNGASPLELYEGYAEKLNGNDIAFVDAIPQAKEGTTVFGWAAPPIKSEALLAKSYTFDEWQTISRIQIADEELYIKSVHRKKVQRIMRMVRLAGSFDTNGRYVVRKMQLVWYRIRRILQIEHMPDNRPDYRVWSKIMVGIYGEPTIKENDRLVEVNNTILPVIRGTDEYRLPVNLEKAMSVGYRRTDRPKSNGELGKRYNETVTDMPTVWCREFVPKEIRNNEFFQRMLHWWKEEVGNSWKLSQQCTEGMICVVDKDFKKIYSQGTGADGKKFTSCMVGKGRHEFFKKCPDAFAASIRDGEGNIIARAILWKNVRCDKTGTIFSLIDVPYSSRDHYKRILINALIQNHGATHYTLARNSIIYDTRNISVDNPQFSIANTNVSSDTCSYMDSFKFLSIREGRAYNYRKNGLDLINIQHQNRTIG